MMMPAMSNNIHYKYFNQTTAYVNKDHKLDSEYKSVVPTCTAESLSFRAILGIAEIFQMLKLEYPDIGDNFVTSESEFRELLKGQVENLTPAGSNSSQSIKLGALVVGSTALNSIMSKYNYGSALSFLDTALAVNFPGYKAKKLSINLYTEIAENIYWLQMTLTIQK